jgi:hypothetical protein
MPKLFIFLVSAVLLASWAPSVFAAPGDPLTLFGHQFNCYPELPVTSPNSADPRHGCGLLDAFEFIDYAFNLLMRDVVIPIAVLMIIWGGYYILTAGGSAERVKKGRKILLAAIVGVTIALAAPLLVDLVYQIIRGGNKPLNP